MHVHCVNNRKPEREFFPQSTHTHVYANPITGIFESSTCGERQARISRNKFVQDEFSLDFRLCWWAHANTERTDVCTVSSKGVNRAGTMVPKSTREM